MDPTHSDIVFILVIITVLIVLMVLLVLNLLVTSRNRRLSHQAELMIIKAEQEKEINRVKQEVTDSTLTEVARDLHDDVGQMISFSIIQLNNATRASEEKRDTYFQEAKTSLQQALDSVRNISKTLSSDYVASFGLRAALERMFDNIRKNHIEVVLSFPDTIQFPNSNSELLTYRIMQECTQNSLKHANPTTIKLLIHQEPGKIICIYSDDGIGFGKLKEDQNDPRQGIGFLNMRKRSELMQAEMEEMELEPQGLQIVLTIPIQ